ncbi:MAG: 3-keto-disaccharide hydrolase [Flavobacteriaceae bacterium]
MIKNISLTLLCLISLNTFAQENWSVLFDGKSMDAWKGYLSPNISPEWTVKDKVLTFTPEPGRTQGGSNIITKEVFHDFELSLEWKISKGGNSGIFWAVVEDSRYKEAYETGPEIQILDNDEHPDGKILTHRAGSLYDMIQAKPDQTNPVGQWNQCIIHIDYTNNEAWVELNGERVVQFKPKGSTWNAMVKNSKFRDWPGFAKLESGHIGLQDHDDIVHYKNIKIKKLK